MASPITEIHRPGPLVRTSAGVVELERAGQEQVHDPPGEADPAGHRQDRERQPAVETERPVARGIRQGDQRERGDADQEDEDPAARQAVARLRR